MRERLSEYWHTIQAELFPILEERLSPLTDRHRQLITTLEFLEIERHMYAHFSCPGMGRPLCNRSALARAFVAKAIYNLSYTDTLIEYLRCDKNLRRICGFERLKDIPSESTFSRAFKEFSEVGLCEVVHTAFIKGVYQDHIVGHISRDSTAIQVHESPTRKVAPLEGCKPGKKPNVIEQQSAMESGEAMLSLLSRCCDVGTKRDSKGYKESWIGYKLHLDVADGDIPISCILTSASVHDSSVSLPLTVITGQKVTYLYELMDSAYDAKAIREFGSKHHHVTITAANTRGDTAQKEQIELNKKQSTFLNMELYPDARRFKQRTSVERINGLLKGYYGGRNIRVKGQHKVMCHLMFGILAITVQQLLHYLS